MFERESVKIAVLLLVVLVLGGCFRQASPDVQPPNNDVPAVAPTVLPTSLQGTMPQPLIFHPE